MVGVCLLTVGPSQPPELPVEPLCQEGNAGKAAAAAAAQVTILPGVWLGGGEEREGRGTFIEMAVEYCLLFGELKSPVNE